MEDPTKQAVQNFVFSLPTRVSFGAGALDSIGQESKCFGRQALVVTGTTFARRSGLIERLTQSLAGVGIGVTLFDRVGPNPSVGIVEEGGTAARAAGADLILGLGGGSVMDAAKAMAASAAGFSPRDISANGAHIPRALPIVQVPLVASTGSETNDAAVLLDEERGIKVMLRAPQLRAQLAVVDPTLTFTVPPRFTAIGAMNIVTQILQAYLTSDEFAVADRLTEGLVRVVMDSLPRAMRRGEDLDARTNLSWTAVLASGVALAGRRHVQPLQAMAHPLTVRHGVEHGLALAALWPSYMRYALANRLRLPQIGRFKRYALLGRQLFGVHETDDEVAAEATAYRFTHWLRSVGLPTSLPDLGLHRLEAETLADEVILGQALGVPLPNGFSAGDIQHIYEGALRPL